MSTDEFAAALTSRRGLALISIAFAAGTAWATASITTSAKLDATRFVAESTRIREELRIAESINSKQDSIAHKTYSLVLTLLCRQYPKDSQCDVRRVP